MFSLGMVICAVYNNGRPLIQAGNSTSNYAKQLETVRNSPKETRLPFSTGLINLLLVPAAKTEDQVASGNWFGKSFVCRLVCQL